LVAAFASWHDRHAVALAAVGRLDAVVAHCLLETYSVLTRLPAPHRMAAAVVSKALRATFDRHRVLGLPPDEQRKLVATCAAQGLSGGSVYDAMIAVTCAHAGARLLTLDTRARPTYAALAVDHELLA
ncbi:MAG: type II toxin-antitoxin system VapC family toxin, partial [Deltaproteobacteria bacterium]